MPGVSMAAAVSKLSGWVECALTTTGQPAASVNAVSPPATEKANGKFEAPNTATGPSGIMGRRRSGRGSDLRSGSAGSVRAFRNSPSHTASANMRS